MNKWIAEFELEDGDTMPEHMDLEYKGAKLDFHCRPLEQEPTTKNDLGVDKLISDCEKMSFDMEIFNKPLKVVALDAVKNIVKDLSLVTPQEPRWIPVSERLPKIAYVYRVTRYYPNNVMNPKYLVDACAFDGSNTWYNDNRINHERAYADNIIAWQENPEPYEPQESEDKE